MPASIGTIGQGHHLAQPVTPDTFPSSNMNRGKREILHTHIGTQAIDIGNDHNQARAKASSHV